MKNHRHYYVASSYMGLNYTYDSPCWTLTAYDTIAEARANSRDQNSEIVSRATAIKICPWLKNHNVHDDQTGYYTYNRGRTVYHG